MKIAALLLVNSMLIFGFTSESFNEPKWISSGNENGIHLYERWIHVNDQLKVRERRGEFISHCSLLDAEMFLKDYTTCTQWMKGISKAELLTQNKDQLIYFVISLPWPFKNRDFIARYLCQRVDAKTCIIRLKNVNNYPLINDKYIHIKDYRASWLVEQISPTTCRITFCTFSSEPPLFPQWMQDPVLKKLFFKNLDRLKNILNELNQKTLTS
nr:hypothetical protein [uncultured Carboxylicivirga sp.]